MGNPGQDLLGRIEALDLPEGLPVEGIGGVAWLLGVDPITGTTDEATLNKYKQAIRHAVDDLKLIRTFMVEVLDTIPPTLPPGKVHVFRAPGFFGGSASGVDAGSLNDWWERRRYGETDSGPAPPSASKPAASKMKMVEHMGRTEFIKLVEWLRSEGNKPSAKALMYAELGGVDSGAQRLQGAADAAYSRPLTTRQLKFVLLGTGDTFRYLDGRIPLGWDSWLKKFAKAEGLKTGKLWWLKNVEDHLRLNGLEPVKVGPAALPLHGEAKKPMSALEHIVASGKRR